MRLRLGDEDDERLVEALKAILDGLGAELDREDFWVAGAVSIHRLHLRVGARKLQVVSETYDGLWLRGARELVTEIAERIRAAREAAPR